MIAVTIIDTTAAVAAVATIVFAAGRFIESVKANTKATDKLSEVIDGHLKWSVEIVREHDERFHEHDVRLTALEVKAPRK
jgi:hypothetical protein